MIFEKGNEFLEDSFVIGKNGVIEESWLRGTAGMTNLCWLNTCLTYAVLTVCVVLISYLSVFGLGPKGIQVEGTIQADSYIESPPLFVSGALA